MNTVIVIAKTPVAGRVKTRLCPPCTADEAAAIATAALSDTIATVRSTPGFTRHVIALDGVAGPWIPHGFDIVAQRGDGLDERLAAAFDDVDDPQAGAGGPMLLIGMDTPQVTTILLASALEHLSRSDSVLGLTVDGGWWCIGLHSADPQVFLGVPMSTPETGRLQRERMTAMGYAPTMLAIVQDVDFFEDALAVATLCEPASSFRAAIKNVEARVTLTRRAQTKQP